MSPNRYINEKLHLATLATMRSGIVMIMHRADAWSMLGMARILAATLATKGCMFDQSKACNAK